MSVLTVQGSFHWATAPEATISVTRRDLDITESNAMHGLRNLQGTRSPALRKRNPFGRDPGALLYENETHTGLTKQKVSVLTARF